MVMSDKISLLSECASLEAPPEKYLGRNHAIVIFSIGPATVPNPGLNYIPKTVTLKFTKEAKPNVRTIHLIQLTPRASAVLQRPPARFRDPAQPQRGADSGNSRHHPARGRQTYQETPLGIGALLGQGYFDWHVYLLKNLCGNSFEPT